MLEAACRVLLAAVLAATALAKLRRPSASIEAMGTHGFAGTASRRAAWAFASGAELILAIGVAAGSDRAAYLAAALMGLFALSLLGAISRGLAGAPCACFGGRSKVGWVTVGGNLLLAMAFAALPAL